MSRPFTPEVLHKPGRVRSSFGSADAAAAQAIVTGTFPMLLNLPRAIAWLDECRLDAVVATSWVNVLYCSDFYLWLHPVFKEYMASPGSSNDLMPLFAVFTREGNATLVVDQVCELSASVSWVPHRYVYGVTSAAAAPMAEQTIGQSSFVRSPHRFATATEALAAALRAERLADARIGLDIEDISLSRRAEMKAALPRADFRDASNLFRILRMVKSDE